MTLKNGMICTATSEPMTCLSSSIATSKDWTTAGRTLLVSVSLCLASTWYVMSLLLSFECIPLTFAAQRHRTTNPRLATPKSSIRDSLPKPKQTRAQQPAEFPKPSVQVRLPSPTRWHRHRRAALHTHIQLATLPARHVYGHPIHVDPTR
jgi:hypothetical protein